MAFTTESLWPIEEPLRVRLDTSFTRDPRPPAATPSPSLATVYSSVTIHHIP